MASIVMVMVTIIISVTNVTHGSKRIDTVDVCGVVKVV